MNSILKFVVIGFSKLPLGILYVISDGLFFLQKYVIQYRKKVVLDNLKNSFPEKSKEELNTIANKHFKNFCDFTLETVKSITISQKELNQRTQFYKEVTDHLFLEHKDVMLLCGHIYNWEWIKRITEDIPTPHMYAVYNMPKSKLVNELVKKSREQFGGETVPMGQVKFLLNKIKSEDKALYLMVADQSPFKTNIHYDLEFMNQRTPVYQGFDKLARKGDVGIVYLHIKRVGRGRFVYTPIEIKPDGEIFQPNEIVHKFFALLEENIRQDPSNYMWTHKRWKYKKGLDY